MKFLNKIFKLTSWKRLLISALLLIAGLLSIIFGSLFYFNSNVNKTYEYNPGTQIVVKIKSDKPDSIDNLKISKSINDRLVDSFGYSGIKVEPYSSDKISISKSGKLSQLELSNFINKVIQKPSIIATSTDMKPLFYLGKFNNSQALDYKNVYDYNIPFKPGSAEYVEQNGNNSVKIALNGNTGETEYSKATESLVGKEILIWLNIQNLYEKAVNEYQSDWQSANQNLYNFIHVNNSVKSKKTDSNEETNNTLKESELNVSKEYLIHNAQVYYVHNGEHLYLSNKATLSNSESKSLVEKINFALGDYSLELFSTHNSQDHSGSQNTYLYAIIGSLVAFAILAFIQIINYGLLGVIAAISSALYAALTLAMFTVVRGEYSPASLSAFLLGMLILFESSSGWFEKFKDRHLGGDSIKKAIINTARFNSLRIIDSNVIIFVSSLIIFFLGTNEIKQFSSFTVFGTIISLIISLIFLKFIIISISTSDYFIEKIRLFGITKLSHKAYIFKNKISVNYFKHFKFILILFTALILISTIIFGALSGTRGGALNGFNISNSFNGYYTINITSLDKSKYFFDSELANNFINYINDSAVLNKSLITQSSIYSITGLDGLTGVSIQLSHQDQNILKQIQELANSYSNNLLSVNSVNITNISSLNALQWVVIGIVISSAVILLYVAFRLGLVFSIVWVLSSVFDFLIIFGLLILTRIQINNYSLIIFLIIFIWSNNEKMHIFTDLKENIKLKYHKQVLITPEILNVANYTITQNLKRFIVSFLGILVLGIGLIFIGTSTNNLPTILIFISLPLILVFSSYLSVYVWVKIFSYSEGIKQKRINTGYWKVNKLEEQTFNGINDYL